MMRGFIAVFFLVLSLGSSLWGAGQKEDPKNPYSIAAGNRRIVIQTPPSSDVTAVAASADGSKYAVGDGAGLVLVYRTSDHLVTNRITTGGGNGVSALEFSPDGTKLVIGTWVTYLYDLPSNRVLNDSNCTQYPTAFVFGPGNEVYGIFEGNGSDREREKRGLYRVFQTDRDKSHTPTRPFVAKPRLLKVLSSDRIAVSTDDGTLDFYNSFLFVSYHKTFGATVLALREIPNGYVVALSDGTVHRVVGENDDLIFESGESALAAAFSSDGGGVYLAERSSVVCYRFEKDGERTDPAFFPGGRDYSQDYKQPSIVAIPGQDAYVTNVIKNSRDPFTNTSSSESVLMPLATTFVGFDDLVLTGPGIGTYRLGDQPYGVDIDLEALKMTRRPSSRVTPADPTGGTGGGNRWSDESLERFDFGTIRNLVVFDQASNGESGVALARNPASISIVWPKSTGRKPRVLKTLDEAMRADKAKYHSSGDPYFLTITDDGSRVTLRYPADQGSLIFIVDTATEQILYHGLIEGTISAYGHRDLSILHENARITALSNDTGKPVASISGNEFDRATHTDSEWALSTISPDAKSFAFVTRGAIVFASLPDFHLIRSVPLASSHENGTVRYTRDGRFLVRVDNEKITFIRPDTGAMVHAMVQGDDWVYFTDDGYFEGSRNAGKLLAIVDAREAHGIDQFALRYNRPDILMERLGTDKTHPQEYAYFKAINAKRLARMGVGNGGGDAVLHAPTSEIARFSADGGAGLISVKFSDASEALTRYTVYVNDVPLYGNEGKALSGHSAEFTETVPLGAGDNKVEVSCFNESGTESIRSLVHLKGPKLAVKPNLYYLGFGVSKYANPDLNLRYAHKDALDLAAAFTAQGQEAYSQVKTKVFTDADVNLSTMEKAKAFLSEAAIEDTVVLFVAGHGVYTKDSLTPDYYYVAHDTDVQNLESTAIRFSSIENLLQGLPSRQKLFLLDTCNSGEVEEVSGDVGATLAQGTQARAVRGLSVKQITPSADAKRTWLVDKDRYSGNDLIRRSGAIVFSSSRGDEFSYETEAAQNGLFTAAILQTLRGELRGDSDGSGSISVRELVNTVSKAVPEMTAGLQHPGVDKDNLSVNFDLPIPGAVRPEVEATDYDTGDFDWLKSVFD